MGGGREDPTGARGRNGGVPSGPFRTLGGEAGKKPDDMDSRGEKCIVECGRVARCPPATSRWVSGNGLWRSDI